ncbi:MAG: polysaccharide biosynthesis protein [Bacteriovoracaceae bacterium]
MVLGIIDKLKLWQRSLLAVVYDFLSAGIAFYLSLAFRYDSFVLGKIQADIFLKSIAIVMVTQTIVFYFCGLYRGIWRFSSTPDLLRVIKGVSAAVICSTFALFLITRLAEIPRSSFFIDWLMLIILLGGGRFSYRMMRDHATYNANSKDFPKTLIVGAGGAGDKLFREIRTNPDISLLVEGFLDDDPFKRKKLINGIPVLGKLEDLADVIKQREIKKVFIAIPSLKSQGIRNIIKQCEGLEIDLLTLPKMSDIIDGNLAFSQLRRVGPEDLLGRNEVKLDNNSLGELIEQRSVLVSGAGGSIGSELCRQILPFNPAKIILFEQSEFNLFQLERDLRAEFPEAKIVPLIGDIRDSQRVEMAFDQFRPEVVFHAAAYKHVPMMEFNCIEAIQTNIKGTHNLASIAKKYNVGRFVMISTDKAVNPTNVMGASKRAAEMVIQMMAKDKESQTRFMTVRFGNVLGSSGSVIPIFQKQIEEGGPVTVTHPEVQRYFMTIPEACQLVVQAGALGVGGEIFVLDMGSPVRIVDLARELISLSGLKVGEDIEIQFTGLRPGEKLYEEIFFEGEGILSTPHPLVKVAAASELPQGFDGSLNALVTLPVSSSNAVIKQYLENLVKEYNPSKEATDRSIVQ